MFVFLTSYVCMVYTDRKGEFLQLLCVVVCADRKGDFFLQLLCVVVCADRDLLVS